MSEIDVKLTKPWHEALADFYIQYPQASGREAAAYFKVSTAWISIVKNSDSFKELLRHRLVAHRELISVSVINKVEALADQALDELAKQMNDRELPVEHVKDIAAMSLKAMGFGGDRGGAAVQNNITIVADRTALAEARDKLLASRATLVIEAAKEEEKENEQHPDGGTSLPA